MRKNINPNNGPTVLGPYSSVVEINNIKNLVFISGQLPLDRNTNNIIGSTITEQANATLQNIVAILDEIGYSLDDVVKTTCFLKTMDDFNEFNEVYAQYFVNKPARTCIGNMQIPKNALCEIEIIVSK